MKKIMLALVTACKLVLLSSGAWAWQDEHQWQLSPRG
jgi:hypothetical protein